MGFLPNVRDASVALDILVLWAGVLIVGLAWSLYAVRFQGRYRLHRLIQAGLTGVLAVALFLLELNLFLDLTWWDRALQSPYNQRGILVPFLWTHRGIASVSCLFWLWTLVTAFHGFESPPTPGAFSRDHKRLAWVATVSVFTTAVTGWMFYWMAFLAV